MVDDVRAPKVVVVVNVREDEDGDVSVVHGVVTDAGVDADFAFAISDLEVYMRRGECDIGVVDLSFPSATRDVANLLKRVARPPLLASMDFFHQAGNAATPEWAVRHIVYNCAQQLGEELAKLVREFQARAAIS